ncbi:MAG: ribonuclease H-like domain-containing protein, partial [Actinobacteria bacterium]|nr:ribonuclease H-like domain-containing protein [Actinomycetota bacterium]
MFRWYVVNTYSGHENKVKQNLEHRVVSLNQKRNVRQVVVPTESVSEMKDNQKVTVEKRTMPGYVLVNMELNEDSWGLVKGTPGVTGFVGASNEPVPLTQAEVDRLLRGQVFVDLYRVVRQGVLVSQEGYGLKKLEPLYLDPREGEITDGGSSIVAYEQWLASPRPSILEAIRAYNEEDCRSTLALRDWLEDRRAELEALDGRELSRPLPVSGAPSTSVAEADERTAALAAGLTAGLPDDRTDDDAEQRARRLLSDVLDWHRREARSEWWAWFDRLARSDDEL